MKVCDWFNSNFSFEERKRFADIEAPKNPDGNTYFVLEGIQNTLFNYHVRGHLFDTHLGRIELFTHRIYNRNAPKGKKRLCKVRLETTKDFIIDYHKSLDVPHEPWMDISSLYGKDFSKYKK